VLFESCKEENIRSYNIEEASEIDSRWFEGTESVGVCGATSTPSWLMNNVAKEIEKL
jgi:4-hydroxy-3-methylbut-2-enyl diphosphate reductase